MRYDPTRRTVLAGLAGAVALPRLSLATPAEPVLLAARPGTAQLGPEGTEPASIWGYGGAVPGPVLRVKQGERLRVRLENGIDQPTTIHWHGVRIDNAMDGVAGLTQPAVEPGGSFDYDFLAPDAGTFWYHPHNLSWEQVARGLMGVLVVEEAEPPAVDRDLVLVVDDWRLDADGRIREDFGNGHDWSHAGRLGNWPTVNGAPQPSLPVQLNERLRLRLLNAANATVLTLRLDGLDGAVVAMDGQPVPLRPLAEIVLAPGQRADVIADVTSDEARLMLAGRENFEAARFAVQGSAREERLGEIAPLPSNPLPLPAEPARAIRLQMTGGAMRGIDRAKVGGHRGHGENGADGAPLDARGLAERGLFWAFNGVAGMPEEPLFSASRGETLAVEMINDTMFPHGMHLHGHHVLDPRDGAWRDTVLLNADERLTVILVADNPGDWMFHCHMLEHQAAGMATWFRVG